MQAGPSASMRRTSRSADQTAARNRDGVRLVDELAVPYPSWAPVDKGRHGVHGGGQVQRSDAEREAAADERDDRHRQLHAELQMQAVRGLQACRSFFLRKMICKFLHCNQWQSTNQNVQPTPPVFVVLVFVVLAAAPSVPLHQIISWRLSLTKQTLSLHPLPGSLRSECRPRPGIPSMKS